jgi:hypothetical protein
MINLNANILSLLNRKLCGQRLKDKGDSPENLQKEIERLSAEIYKIKAGKTSAFGQKLTISEPKRTP